MFVRICLSFADVFTIETEGVGHVKGLSFLITNIL